MNQKNCRKLFLQSYMIHWVSMGRKTPFIHSVPEKFSPGTKSNKTGLKLTCNIPGRGALVFLSTFFRGFNPSRSSVLSAWTSVMVGGCSVTVNSGSLVARKLPIMFVCSFYKKKGSLLLISIQK